LCSPTSQTEEIRPGIDKGASCVSQAGWRFEGLWYHVAPIACGQWLVEPAVTGMDAVKTTQLKLRSLQSGEMVATARVAVEDLRCMSDSLLFDVAGGRTIALPSLKAGKRLACGGAKVRDVADMHASRRCLNVRGVAATLGR